MITRNGHRGLRSKFLEVAGISFYLLIDNLLDHYLLPFFISSQSLVACPLIVAVNLFLFI